MRLNIRGMLSWLLLFFGFFAGIGLMDHHYQSSNTAHFRISESQQFHGIAKNSSQYHPTDSSQYGQL